MRRGLTVLLTVCASLCLAGPALAAPPHSVFVNPNSPGPASDTQLTVKTEIGSDPARGPLHYHLEYGTSSSLDTYTSTSEWYPAAVPDEPGHYVDVETIEGLSPDTTYYVRAVATNADGTTKSTEPCSIDGTCSPPQKFTTIGPLVIQTGDHGPVKFDDSVGLLKFSGSGMVNGGGRSGNGGIQVSLYPDFRSGDRTGCDPGASEAASVNFNDRTDHQYTHRCTVSVPPAERTQDVTVYMRAYFAGVESGGYCTRETYSDPYNCVGQTVTFQVPASTFAGGDSPSTDSIRSAVVSALSPKGAAAKIGSILQKGFSAASLDAPSAGTAAIVWKSAPTGASGAASVVVAKGSKSVSAAGKTQVKVRLTGRGRALLRRAKRKKSAVRVRATGSFTPSGGDTVTQTRLVKLRK